MEKKIAEAHNVVQQEHMSVSKVVTDVLAEQTNKNQFLQNVGLQDVRPRTSAQNLQEQLEEEKRGNIELWSVVHTQQEQIDVLSQQVHKAEQARVKDKEEVQKKLDLLLSQMRSWTWRVRWLRTF
jgi:hypothetical protein